MPTVNLSSRDTAMRDTLYAVKPVFKDTLMREHPLYSKTVFKGHCDERTPSIQ